MMFVVYTRRHMRTSFRKSAKGQQIKYGVPLISPAPLSIVFVPPDQTASILVDGKLTEPGVERLERLDREVKVVKFSLVAGSTVRVTAQ
jgi:hypothetical protein